MSSISNFYPTKEVETSNLRHGPVGLGIMGLADALYMLDIDFDSEEAVKYNDEMMEAISYYAILGSSRARKERGAYSSFKWSKWDRGILPIDTLSLLDAERGERVEVNRNCTLDWTPCSWAHQAVWYETLTVWLSLRAATISKYRRCLPMYRTDLQNLYVKSNLSGEFTVINDYLVADLQKLVSGTLRWSQNSSSTMGSIQKIDRIPARLRAKYKKYLRFHQSGWLKTAAVRGNGSTSLNQSTSS